MERAPDSTEVDPEGHRVTLENDFVRVIEVNKAAGADLAMHSHPRRVIVAITAYRLRSIDRDGNGTVIDRSPGDVVWSDGEEHAATMVTDVHAIEVEIKR